MFNLINMLLSLCAVFMAIVLHEVAHGYMAYILGDDTAKRAQRLSLNPIKHIDPFGSVILPLALALSGTNFLFGWAKPVPVNFQNLKKWPRDMLLVSGAGIAMNLTLAIFSAVVFQFKDYIPSFITLFFLYFMVSNVVLAFFNLLPIPPLDGSKLFFGWIEKPWARQYVNSTQYGMMTLIIFIVIIPLIGSALGINIIDPLRWYLSKCFLVFQYLIG